MAEYIKRSAVFEQFDNADADVCETDDFGGIDYGFGIKNIKELINAISAADVAEVVHGRKIEDGDIGCFWLCSLCGECLPYGANYCPNCGAKMDGGGDDADD